MVKFDLINNINEREIIMNEERLDVLDKVKELVMLKGTEYMTTQMVADYYNIPKGTIDAVVNRNKDELIKNGYKLVSGKELKEILVKANIHFINYKGYFECNEEKFANRSNGLFNKKSILNIALLLKDNEIADKIKQELGICPSWNTNLRKEIKFKNELDLSIKKIRQVMINNMGLLPHTKIYS